MRARAAHFVATVAVFAAGCSRHIIGTDFPPPADGGGTPPPVDSGRPDSGTASPFPWAGGSLTLTPRPFPLPAGFHDPRPTDCGPGCRRLVVNSAPRSAHDYCLVGGYLYTGSQAAVRVRLADGQVEALTDATPSSPAAIAVGCGPEGPILAVVASTSTQFGGAVVQFPGTDLTGRLLWEWGPFLRADAQNAASVSPEVVSASAQVLAFTAERPGEPLDLWIATPAGATPRPLTYGFPAPTASVEGDRIVFDKADEVWTWRVGDAAPTNLSNTPQADEWSAWLDGGRMAFISTRDGSGDRYAPNNSEVYLYDFATGQTTRITNDPPDHPAVQSDVSISGDWIVWTDWRNAPQPNGSQETNGSEIWGYHLPTHSEHQLATIRTSDPTLGWMAIPRVLGGKLYYLTGEGAQTGPNGEFYEIRSVYEQTLPTP